MTITTAQIHRLQAAYRKYRNLDAAVDAIGEEAECLFAAGDLASADTIDALDAEWDAAYNACNAARTSVIDLIVDLIHIDRKTAYAMLCHYPERLERLMNATVVDAGKEA